MQLIKNFKRALKGAAVTVLGTALALAPATPAFATESSSDEIVGNLSIVTAMVDPDTGSITDGHAFVMFTSYQDDLTLDFTDLYGYYELTDEFKQATEADQSEYSWRAHFREIADSLGYTDLTLEEYTSTPENRRDDDDFKYKDLYDAIIQYANKSFVASENENADHVQYKKISHSYTLGAGEYLTIGNYTYDHSKQELFHDAFTNSTAYPDLMVILNNGLKDGVTTTEILENIQTILTKYLDDELTDDELIQQLGAYAQTVLTEDGYNSFMNLLNSDIVKLFDGDGKGGLFVNREMWRQKSWQTLQPNKVYSVDITRSQLERLLACANGGTENHYAAVTHNCSTAAVNLWNAAVGVDENGNQTSLYVDGLDKSLAYFENIFTTPMQIQKVLTSWQGSYSMDYIHGVSVPATTYTVSFDSAGGSEVGSQQVAENECATDPGSPTRDGYTFAGWLLNGEAYDFATPVTGNITLVASWTENATPQPTESETTNKTTKKTNGPLAQTGDNTMAAIVTMAAIGVASIFFAVRRLS